RASGRVNDFPEQLDRRPSAGGTCLAGKSLPAARFSQSVWLCSNVQQRGKFRSSRRPGDSRPDSNIRQNAGFDSWVGEYGGRIKCTGDTTRPATDISFARIEQFQPIWASNVSK